MGTKNYPAGYRGWRPPQRDVSHWWWRLSCRYDAWGRSGTLAKVLLLAIVVLAIRVAWLSVDAANLSRSEAPLRSCVDAYHAALTGTPISDTVVVMDPRVVADCP